MITVDIKKLIENIAEADAFELPDMSDGTKYLYENIYQSLAREDVVRLSQINFDSFELDDLDAMQDFYSGVLEANEQKAGAITQFLQRLPPAAVPAAFI